MRTYDLTHCESADGWSLHAPGVTDDQIASGDADSLMSGEGTPTQDAYDSAAHEAACRAAKHIGSVWRDGKCEYYDDSTSASYLCDDLSEMVHLYELMSDSDPDIARDAYSHWCAATSHAEIESSQ